MTGQIDTGLISDGYHTFNELYEHRHALMLALMKAIPQHSWFSRRHHDGELCFGDGEWFIVGAELPESSTVTYHLPMRLWGLAELTGAAELERGRPWDGHTANDVVHRLKAWASRPSAQEETVEDIFHQNLSSLRGRFERIVFTATYPDAERISHIELADRLIDAVVSELALIQRETIMNNFKEICKALLDEIPYESPTTCLAREALLNDDGSSRPTAKELRTLWQVCNSPSVFACAVLERWGNLKAETVPVSKKPLTDEQIIERLRAESESRASDLWNSLIRVKVPVPVSEKPWERPGWCDKRWRCWAWSPARKCWHLMDPRIAVDWIRLLPFDAIPSLGPGDETGGEQ